MDNSFGNQLFLRKRFWLFLAITFLIYFLMRWLSGGLSGEQIVAFEVAKSAIVANDIMRGWDESLRQDYLWSIYVDYFLLVAYSGFLFYACRYTALLSRNQVVEGAAGFFSWLAPLAGLMDAIENSGMIYTIRINVNDAVVHFTYDMAVVKFSLLLIVVLFILVAVLMWVIVNLENASRKSS
jgi:hypothetical protein